MYLKENNLLHWTIKRWKLCISKETKQDGPV